MSKKKELDFDEEVKRLARKSNIKIQKTEYAYDNQLKKLDKEIDKAVNDKIKLFEKNKDFSSKYIDRKVSHDTIDRYREKLKKI